MSYPRQIHTLIIEDESSVQENYRIGFESLHQKYDIIRPTFALSFDDACAKLDAPSIYHLVIVDLGLPYKTRQEAQAGVEPGLQLVQRVSVREHHPVPALLVISARMGLLNLSGLHDQLSRNFWYGKLVNKGINDFEQIESAFQSIHKYCDVGLHLQDGGKRWYPTLSPREEDLIRRCVLAQGDIGVDLRWWGAERGRSGAVEDYDNGATKVLMGRFILDHGQGCSRSTFFKFEPAGDARYVFMNAAIMAQKLLHVKVCHTCTSSTRGLLVTQCVSEGQPMALGEFLHGDPKLTSQLIPKVVQNIVEQLFALGTVEESQIPVSGAFTRYLVENRPKLEEAWLAYASNDVKQAADGSPLALFDHLAQSQKLVWVKLKTCNHGDLNASNVAIEPHAQDVRAFIFDPGSIEHDIAVRDLAWLEVTSLLFEKADNGSSLVDECRVLYETAVAVPANVDYASGSPLAQNIKMLIAEIRRAALEHCEPDVYACLVFNAALCQLLGLAIDPARNKITDRASAACLAAVTARWVAKVAPGVAQ